MAGVDTAYYLVHSMGSRASFEREDRAGRRELRARPPARRACGASSTSAASAPGATSRSHLRSRHEVGRILRESGVPTIEFRASIVIGSGSLSFEMIRALVERLPVMITPRWVRTPAQPIAHRGRARLPRRGARRRRSAAAASSRSAAPTASPTATSCASTRASAGLRRLMMPVPVLTPRLSSLWLGLVTPLYARVGRKLIESLRHATVVRDPARARDVRDPPARHARGDRARPGERGPRVRRDALVGRALLGRRRRGRWGGARFGTPPGRLARRARAACRRAPAFAPIRRIGGATGWYCADWLWRLRGFLDLLAGGVGMRRGRRDPGRARARRDASTSGASRRSSPDRLLRLAAEMKLPGRAWLEFEVDAATRRVDHPADRDLRSGRPRRARLLVRPLPVPHARLRRHAARHRPGSAKRHVIRRVGRPYEGGGLPGTLPNR